MSISKEELEKIMEKKSGMRREAYDRRAAQEIKTKLAQVPVRDLWIFQNIKKLR